ncbi:hypothetical protein OF83DRAFT_1159824 [Amylostereum chailletii]|nr:hypothetical protein OF83DRAFT_1159824 [Amylostereum chailletii]
MIFVIAVLVTLLPNFVLAVSLVRGVLEVVRLTVLVALLSVAVVSSYRTSAIVTPLRFFREARARRAREAQANARRRGGARGGRSLPTEDGVREGS